MVFVLSQDIVFWLFSRNSEYFRTQVASFLDLDPSSPSLSLHTLQDPILLFKSILRRISPRCRLPSTPRLTFIPRMLLSSCLMALLLLWSPSRISMLGTGMPMLAASATVLNLVHALLCYSLLLPLRSHTSVKRPSSFSTSCHSSSVSSEHFFSPSTLSALGTVWSHDTSPTTQISPKEHTLPASLEVSFLSS